jgi:hypothetical protein
MHSHNGRGSRGTAPAKRRLLPEQTAANTAANHGLALKWREEWRTGKAAAPSQPAGIKAIAAPKPAEDQRKRRAKFAEAIARLEFGRSYWDERRQREVGKNAAGSPRPGRHGGK